MLLPYSYHTKKTEKEIHNLVGKPIGLIDRIKLRGIGSQRFLVQEANTEIMELVNNQNTPPYTNIELRPRGIIIWFRVKLDNWVLVLPYRKLSVFKTAEQLIIHQDQWKLKLSAAHDASLNLKFCQKLMRLKAEMASSV
jgi:hypothetical protein